MSTEASADNSKENSAVPEHLRPHCFKPGQSGNPGGRPRKPLADGLKAALDNPEELAQVIAGILSKAKKGDVSAFAAIRDTTEGKPIESVEHSGPDGGPIQNEFTVRFVEPDGK